MSTHPSGSAKASKLIDNERVVVWKWEFAKPGDNTGWHRHEHDYVVVPLMDGRLKIVDQKGESIAQMTKGAPYFRQTGIEHDVVNASDGDYAFIEIELK
jgi:mannose-6-phosphate isomerase-like protein (cupin superfamily)